jgi:hypothetical protein
MADEERSPGQKESTSKVGPWIYMQKPDDACDCGAVDDQSHDHSCPQYKA